jgi:hypothetical protein
MREYLNWSATVPETPSRSLFVKQPSESCSALARSTTLTSEAIWRTSPPLTVSACPRASRDAPALPMCCLKGHATIWRIFNAC